MDALRRRPLDLRGLPRRVQGFATAALVTAALSALAVLVVGEDILPIRGGVPRPRLEQWPLDLFGVDVFVSNAGISEQSWLVTTLVYAGLATGSATLVYGALRPGWRAPRLTLVLVALGAMVCAALLKTVADRLGEFPEDLTTGSLSSGLTRFRIAGWAGFACSLAVLLAPLRLQRRAPLAFAAAAGAPFLFGLAAWATAGDGGFASQSLGSIQRLKGLGAGVAFQTADVATLVLALLLLWGVVEAVRASRDAALAMPLRGNALAPLLGAKLVWVAVGLAGALPAWLGGASAIWSHSWNDGAASWAIAAALGIAFAALLALRPALDTPTVATGLVAIAVILASSALQFVADTADTALRAWWDRERLPLLTWFTEWWSDYSVVLTIGLLAAAAPVGLAVFRRNRTIGVFLVLLGTWALPRAIAVAINLAEKPRGAVADGTLVERHNRLGWIDLVSLDVAVTVAVAILAALWWRGRQRAVPPRALLFVLLGSTIATYTAQLLPDTFRAGRFFYLGIVFPLAYQFLLDSESLNERAPARSVRVLAATGLAAVSVAAALNGVSTTVLSPVRPSATNIGLSIYKGPLLLVVLIASLPLVARRISPAPRGNTPIL